MEIPALHTNFCVIFREIFRHSLRERRHEHAFILFRSFADLVQQIIDLPTDGTDFDFRIRQSRWADDLLSHHSAGFG